jgi:AraC family transcriptional regulator
MVPQFNVIGKYHHLPSADLAAATPRMALDFWENERLSIKTAAHSGLTYIGIARNYNFCDGFADYVASIPVHNTGNIPDGLKADSFDASLCARFRYIGQHHYFDLNRERMEPMYAEIYQFRTNKQEKYALMNDKVYFEKVDVSLYDGTYCQMEWFAPVVEKENRSTHD